jgi:beta-carotene 3-hydroxylase
MFSNTLTFTFFFIATFAFMEFAANFSHKHIMHGFMWYWHEDHHRKKPKRFEKNDIFFVIFASPCILLLVSNLWYPSVYSSAIGLGIMFYGMAYFIVHDLIIHQRINNKFLREHPYVKGLIQAHKDHHANINQHDCHNFGMLWVPLKYFNGTYAQI